MKVKRKPPDFGKPYISAESRDRDHLIAAAGFRGIAFRMRRIEGRECEGFPQPSNE
jgi:hypothetical protein